MLAQNEVTIRRTGDVINPGKAVTQFFQLIAAGEETSIASGAQTYRRRVFKGGRGIFGKTKPARLLGAAMLAIDIVDAKGCIPVLHTAPQKRGRIVTGGAAFGCGFCKESDEFFALG